MTRNAAFDHIRIVLTCLVIAHHVSIVYGGSGGWYWREQPDGSNLLLLSFNAINQSFFMGFFFLLAGYYTPSSFDRKGAARFLTERLLRLGIPLALYFFVISPFTNALARSQEGDSFWASWASASRFGRFEPGPLWFSEALILFALLYFLWRSVKLTTAGGLSKMPSFTTLLIAAISLGLISFATRLAVPVGESVAWLQLGYFPCYIFLFVAGCMASRLGLLENASFRYALPWIVITLIALVSLPIVMMTRLEAGSFRGGWTFNAFYYALWDPLMAWGIILGMLWAFRSYWSSEGKLPALLSRRAYGAYVFHPPVIVAISILLASWDAAPLLKFAVASASACIGSFATSAVFLAIPGARRIF